MEKNICFHSTLQTNKCEKGVPFEVTYHTILKSLNKENVLNGTYGLILKCTEAEQLFGAD